MSDLDIVTFDWVEKTLVTQVATAENALAAFNREPLDDVKARQKRLLACLFSIQQVTGCLRSLNLTKGALLTAELERALQRLFQDELQGERRLLVLGGVLQGVKLLPAYLAHIREVRRDTGDGLIRCVNDLRRWMGEPARPSCLFFSPALAPGAGVTPGGDRTDEGALRETVATERAAYRRAAQAAMRAADQRVTRDTEPVWFGTATGFAPPERLPVLVGKVDRLDRGEGLPPRYVRREQSAPETMKVVRRFRAAARRRQRARAVVEPRVERCELGGLLQHRLVGGQLRRLQLPPLRWPCAGHQCGGA